MLRDSIAKFLNIEGLVSNLTGYLETRLELFKIEAREEFSRGLANVMVYLVMGFAFVLALVFVSVAVALVIGAALGDFFIGFSIVAAFYLVVGVILIVAREALTQKIEKKMSVMFNKKKE